MRHGGRGTAVWIVLALVVGLVIGAALTSGDPRPTTSSSPIGAGGSTSGSTPSGSVSLGSAASGSAGSITATPSGTPAASAGTAALGTSATIDTFSGLCSEPTGATQTATVVRVIDGDTIVVDRGNGQEHLRYIGMDTPETVKPGTPVQPFGPQASEANGRLVGGQTVSLEKDVSEVDRYGRLLRFVWLRDATQPSGWLMVDRALLRDGLATVTTFPPDVKCVAAFLADQRSAQARGLGLWGDGAGFGTSAPTSSSPSASSAPAATASAPPSASAAGTSAFYRPPGWDGVSDVDCKDFQTHAQAQSFFVGTGGSRTNDPYRLDADHDGLACESLP